MSTSKIKKLIIVESPTKAKTITKFLGNEYIIRSSFGHLRDLPKSKLGVDTENNFKPEYVINPKSKKQAAELKKYAKECDEIILASDEDREGEAIAWHLAQLLNLEGFGTGKKEKKYKRIVFHEITKKAILNALDNPRSIDMNLVDAQQARRILDRLVGYKLSPLLWKKIRYGLSAGRVQSVTVRLIVEKEEEINKFKAEEYWLIEAMVQQVHYDKKCHSELVEGFNARLIKIDGKSIGKLGVKTKKEAEKIKQDLEKAKYEIEKITKKETKKNPVPPFTTSTLQQASSNKFGYSAKQTMMIAQQLYEGINLGSKGSSGLITYMRTDSLSLSKSSLESAENYIKNKFGNKYAERRFFKTKSKGAQEAHEAIRPTNPEIDPESIKEFLDNKQFKIYELIWQRMVASQMASAIVDSTIIDILAESKKEFNSEASGLNSFLLRATGSTIKFKGFLKVYPIKSEEIILPKLTEKEKLDLIKIISEQHFTQPPARFNEASLIKVLEELGIGRPSTYAPTISTIQDRGYIKKIEKRLHPQEIGILVNKLLVEHFPKIVNVKFTAKMEEDLDKVAENKKNWVVILKDFYKPFKTNLMQKEKEIDKKELTEEATDKVCEKCGKPMIIKMGRFGKFMACSNYPDCKNTKQLDDKGEIEEPEITNEICEKCGKPMVFKIGRYGKFLGCSGYPNCKNIKPIVKSTGVQCPECGKGEIVEKKSKAGRVFFACSGYPNCKYAMWNKPTGEKCPKCGSLIVYAKNDSVACSNKECK